MFPHVEHLWNLNIESIHDIYMMYILVYAAAGRR